MRITRAELNRLPWRGPGADRPSLPLPPGPMPFRDGGAFRKRWRYVGAYDESVMLGVASVEVGPAKLEFWAVWDRARGELHEGSRRLLPGRRRRVAMSGGPVAEANTITPSGAAAGVAATGPPGERVTLHGGEVELDLQLDPGAWIETICPADGDGPAGSGSYTWTRKLAAVGAAGEVRIGDRRLALSGMGLIDDTAGYHPRRTSWTWCSGVGFSTAGEPLGWNLVTGVNDPLESSERAIWVDGVSSEPGPVLFSGTDAVRFADGSELVCSAEAERVHREGVPFLMSSEYRAPFGTFSGTLPGGVELASGMGVMEAHDAVW